MDLPSLDRARKFWCGCATSRSPSRPLAGTRPRGATPEADQQLERDLLADPKERAEHLMLLDLGRNDVGRVSEIGSVHVAQSFEIERYSHVMHISSTVHGTLDRTQPRRDRCVDGGIAGGVRCRARRRCGQCKLSTSWKYLNAGPTAVAWVIFRPTGKWTRAFVLRTAIVKDGMIHVQAGAGVVTDSVPEAEQQECVMKAAALFRRCRRSCALRDHEQTRQPIMRACF